MKKVLSIVGLLMLSFLVSGCSYVKKSEYETVLSKYNTEKQNSEGLQNAKDKLQNEYNALQKKNNEIKEELSKAHDEITAFTELKEKYSALSESEIEKQTEENKLAATKAKEEQKRIAAEEAKQKEEEERKAKEKAEQEAKKGYNTGITYNQLARTPDDYEGKLVKFTGTVVQLIQGTDEVDIRLAINGDYDKIIYGYYDPSISSVRVLEDDTITIYGVSKNLYTYESTLGASITIPLVAIDKLDIK